MHEHPHFDTRADLLLYQSIIQDQEPKLKINRLAPNSPIVKPALSRDVLPPAACLGKFA